jgi:hypothetical protein
MENISMKDIEIAMGRVERKEFVEFGLKEYDSLVRGKLSRLVARLCNRPVCTRNEYRERLTKFIEIIYPYSKE